MQYGVVGVVVLLVLSTGGVATSGVGVTDHDEQDDPGAGNADQGPDDADREPGNVDGRTGNLEVRWTNDPETDTTLQSNHHTPAAVHFRGETYVAVPRNGRHGSFCALSVLDGDGDLRWRDTIPDERCTVHAVSDPAIADFDGDGRPEVVAATSEEVLVAYTLATGEVELRRNLTSYGYSKPVVADLVPAAGRETVVVDLLGGVFVFERGGATAWHRRLDDARVRQPAVDDFDADGRPELVVGQLSGPVTLLEADGATAWRTNVSDSVATRWMTAGDLDADPAVEVAVATYTGHVAALDGASGAVEWTLDLGATEGGAASVPAGAALAGSLSLAGGPVLHGTTGAAVRAVGDGDGDGRVEVYPVARDGKLYAVTGANGSVEWSTALADGPVSVAPPPSIGDVDGDDRPELVVATAEGTVGVVDPTDRTVLATYERRGTVRTFPRLSDLDGDSVLEILVIYGDGRVVALSYGFPDDVTGREGVVLRYGCHN